MNKFKYIPIFGEQIDSPKTGVIQMPVTLDAANRKKDKGVSLRFTTTFEVSNSDFSEMDRHVGNIGWLLFKENDSFELDDMPKEDAPSDGTKSKLQRLRAVHFLYWKTKTDQSETFNNWWDRQFEKLLDKYKERLD